VPLGVNRYFELIEADRFRPDHIDWMVCHYSSHVFREKIFQLLKKGGGMIPEERWFTNLYTKGNTGSASIFIMLEELLNEEHLEPGQRILCMVPESGRFVISFMQLTVVGATAQIPEVNSSHRIEEEDNSTTRSLQQTVDETSLVVNETSLESVLRRRLALVWIDFETRLNHIPILDKIQRGKLRIEDYRLLLLNLRQQVIDGARWISRAASNITVEAFALRSMFINHAAEEHRDFQLIEKDFIATGGHIEEITRAEKNIGSEALSAWMFHRASRENPFDLLGAMFIIEGLGMRLAKKWATKIRAQLGLDDHQLSFLLYHGANDRDHFEKLESALGGGILTEELVAQIVKTAKVTARLYALQLEEIGNT
jgi:3-oxoacyl-[acyl-carrier-protein] synthase-3